MKKFSLLSLLIIVLPAALLPGAARAQSRLAAATEAGERASDRIALVRERVHVDIDQQYARTRLHQVFESRAAARLEGRYHLQVGEGARVHGFAYWNGEQKIVGEVFEKQTATRVYEEVTGLGRDPGLLEQEGEGAFSFRLFPIEPGERKRVEVAYGRWLARTGNAVSYRVPLGHEASEVEVAITDERGIVDVTSATHALALERLDDGHMIARARGNGAGGELVLRYRVGAADWAVSAFVHRDPGHDAYLVATVAAPEDVDAGAVAAKDVTLVLDRSGSMSGEPLARAREAARAVVARLRARDRVNVLAFDDDADLLYPRPRPVTDDVRAEALGYIERLRDGGGTNLALALERALAAQHQDDQDDQDDHDGHDGQDGPGGDEGARPHVILFLTDGQSNAQATLQAARADQGDARVFTIGVGNGVQKPLLSRLAAEKRGGFTFIESPRAIERKVARLYAQIESPVLVGLSLDVQGAGDVRLARTYPRTLSDLFRDDELVIVSRVRGEGPVTLTLRGERAGQPVAFTKDLVVPAAAARPWVGRLWAQARVDDLLEEIALTGETEELTGEIIDLAVAYNFVTPYTSFLAIPESELTANARDMLASARERKQQILAAHQDAVALSRSAMPPGDPILEVRAPADARQVTAYFPFGLVKDLTYDASAEHWRVRFLVPKHVVDGDYLVKIVIVHADGTVKMAHVPYTIDSSASDFEVMVEEVPGGAIVKVTTAEAARLVTVAAASDPALRVELAEQDGGLRFEGFVALPAGTHDLRVVVADTARNESDDTITVQVPDVNGEEQ